MKSFHITMKILDYFFFILPHKKFVKSSWKNGQISIKWFSLGQIDWSWIEGCCIDTFLMDILQCAQGTRTLD